MRAPTGEEFAIALRVVIAHLVGLANASPKCVDDPIVFTRDATFTSVAGCTVRQAEDMFRAGSVEGAVRVPRRGWSARLSDVRAALARTQAARRARRIPTKADNNNSAAEPPRRDPLSAKGSPRKRGEDRAA